jgi:hypothetical protein
MYDDRFVTCSSKVPTTGSTYLVNATFDDRKIKEENPKQNL